MSREIKTAGFVGWRGMVGQVLIDRMEQEGDFDLGFTPLFFSTSADVKEPPLPSPMSVLDSNNLKELAGCDVIVSCQGGDWTSAIYPQLRESGWNGYWIDAASTLRLQNDAIIVLDPINRAQIEHALQEGIKTYVGGNCTVSLMLLALQGLYANNLVEWVSSMTYQAASGAGAKHVTELLAQMEALGKAWGSVSRISHPVHRRCGFLDQTMRSEQFPTDNFGVPLAGSLIPWIDKPMDNGQSREEWKGAVEAGKILGRETIIDGVCTRVGVMRCHSQALLIKLNQEFSAADAAALLRYNDWVRVIDNSKEETLAGLTPAAVSGTLDIAIGRIRKPLFPGNFLTAFTVGDQLLWGAAEPLRRMLLILLGKM